MLLINEKISKCHSVFFPLDKNTDIIEHLIYFTKYYICSTRFNNFYIFNLVAFFKISRFVNYFVNLELHGCNNWN